MAATMPPLQAGGLTITSASTPSLNGTYGATQTVLNGIEGQINAILLSSGATFADGTESLGWPDHVGTLHTFNIAQFREFGMAMSNFISQCAVYQSGDTTVVPSNSATIA